MKINNFLKFIISIVVADLAGVVGAFFTIPAISDWYASLAKPALTLPDWLFGPVWAALYFLIGAALFLVWKNDWKAVNMAFEKRTKPWNRYSEQLWTGSWQKFNILSIFFVQYALNIFWPYLFFGLRSPFFALFEIIALWFSIVFVIANFYRVSKTSAWLLAPYLLWVSFAVYLNYAIWALN